MSVEYQVGDVSFYKNGIHIHRDEVVKQNHRIYPQWKRDPQSVDPNGKISALENSEITLHLAMRFAGRVRNTNLISSTSPISYAELNLTREIIHSIGKIEGRIIADPEREPWNNSVLEHVEQVEAVTYVLTEEYNKVNSHEPLDINRMRVKALVHDIGRAKSHHPLIHGFAGREMLKLLGFAADFRTTTIAHLEAGAGPYLVGITPENWNIIGSDSRKINTVVNRLPIQEVIIAMADMCKKGEQLEDGTFKNTIFYPIEGIFLSAARRLKITSNPPSAEMLMPLSSNIKSDREKALTALKNTGLVDIEINQMALYFGWCGAIKRRLEKELQISFSGKNGIVEKSSAKYKEISDNNQT